jgi:hypothetical protein
LDGARRAAYHEAIRSLVEATVAGGLSPRKLLRAGLPSAVRGLAPEWFRAAVGLAARLVRRRVDPACVLEHGLPVVTAASPTLDAFHANLAVLEELVARCVAEPQLRWDAVAEDLAALTQAALAFHGRNVPYAVRVTPERVEALVIEGWIPAFELPVCREIRTVASPQAIELVACPVATPCGALAAVS